MEVRSFLRLLNTSSWHLRYNFFSTNVQNLKCLGCEAEIMRKLVKKFQSLVHNILEIWSVEGSACLGSRISSQRGDHGKIFITLSQSIRLEFYKMWLEENGI